MSIEINGQPTSLPAQINSSNRQNEATKGQTDSPQASDQNGVEGDSVNLTNTASMLKNMEATLSSVPVVDHQRVANIKQALSNGTFDINPERIAAKMLSFESTIRSR